MKDLIRKIGYGLFVVLIAVVSFKSCISELFSSKEEIERKEFERRNLKQEFWDGDYTGDVELLTDISYVNNYNYRFHIDPMTSWSANIRIEYDSVIYVVLDGDTLKYPELKPFKAVKNESIKFFTSDSLEYELIID